MASRPHPASAAGGLGGPEPVRLRVLQLNCQRSRGVMAELGQALVEGCYDAALLQEPYLRAGGVVAGLPAWMRVFPSGDGKSAVVLSNASLDATVVTVPGGDGGVTVWVRGGFGTLYLSSVYCRFGEPLGGYFQYLEWVFTQLPGVPVVAGMDANAVSRLWHSKNRFRGHQNAVRGGEFEAFIVACDLEVLNEPSQHFTFDGPPGRSDIDITLGKGVERVYRVGWEILPDLVHSDHNSICVTLLRRDGEADLPLPVLRWRTVGVDWAAYGAALVQAADGLDRGALAGAGPVVLAEAVASLLQGVNDSRLGRAGTEPRRKSRWWNRELTSARRLARRARVALQRARRREEPEEVRAGLRVTYRELSRSYHRLVLQRKEEDWRGFVGEVGNADPWGDVYRILRGRRGPVDIGGVRVGGALATSWEASARALLERFFPRLPEREPQEEGRPALDPPAP